MSISSRKPIFITLVIVFIAVFSVVLNSLMFTAYSDRYCSVSVEDSISNKVFLKKVEIEPNVLLINNNQIKILDCWIEKEARIYKLFFFKYSKHLGHYRLCLKVKYPDETMRYDYTFAFKGLTDGAGALEPKLDVCIYYSFIDINRPQSVHVSLLQNNNEIDEIILKIE